MKKTKSRNKMGLQKDIKNSKQKISRNNFLTVLVNKLTKITNYSLNVLSFPLPRNKNVWVFGSWFGQKFADNSKYLFLYIKKFHPEIRAIWLTHNNKVLEDLKRKGYEAYKAYSLKGFLYSMRAGCTIVSTSLGDINGFVIAGSKKIQLWHGTPLKKILCDDKRNLENYKKRGKLVKFAKKLKNKVLPDDTRYIATSEEVRNKICSAFRVDKKQVYIVGYPRNDALFSTPWLDSNICDYLENIRSKVDFKYIIVYLPTHRGEGKKKVDLFEKYNFKMDLLQQMLENLNAIFIIKAHHYHDKIDLPYSKKNLQRIYTPSGDELPDIYPLLKETDILITDYSSVYFDYLLLDRPIIFAPFDIDDYQREERGLYYDYNVVTPGPKAKDWQEVFRLVEEILKRDQWKKERKIICERFNKFKDNRNSERVFEAIRRLRK